MSFATYFKSSSYAMIAVAMLALMLAGGLHAGLAIAFVALLILAWKLEGKKWQLSERVGLAIVLLSIPLFFIDWQYQKAIGEARERLGVNALAHLIIFLSAVKLLQVKADRDWVFLYLISFFEVLLAAGLSFSPMFLGTLTLYLFCGLSTVIAFEIRKARRFIPATETRLLVASHPTVFHRLVVRHTAGGTETRRLPAVAGALLALIFLLAVPLFLVAPRAGSAAISRAGAGLSHFVGFSESVTLGEIGTLKTNNEVVMRVRLEEPDSHLQELRWRGVALDEFTGKGWRKSSEARRLVQRPADRGLVQLGTTVALHRLTTQTVFLEPMESSVLFALPRAVAIQGDFPSLQLDGEGSIQSRRQPFDRIIYKALSETNEPDPETLREDFLPYPDDFARYLLLPSSLDDRIGDRARAIVANHHARTRYDIAQTIESELRQDYGYTLEMKSRGPDPLADFLFNVREGHCEYFSTAMAVMLRTQGVAARVVNGFLPGEYNEAAGAYTVRQSDAHSWVEVYFPQTKSWVTFDPTPAAGRTLPQSSGLAAELGKYAEALELMWFQYVIGYDKQEQRSLATSLQSQIFRYQHLVGDWMTRLRRISWRKPFLVSFFVILAIFTSILLLRLKRLGWRGLRVSFRKESSLHSAIGFYERLIKLLARRGIHRLPEQTPLEFAASVGLKEAEILTGAYNRVRYGAHRLSHSEQKQIEEILLKLEQNS